LYQQSLLEPKNDMVSLQSAFLRSKSVQARKTLGQFFTSPVVADYMASLLHKPKGKKIRILDAGAGTGVLTAATAMQLLKLGCKAVHAVLYELDSSVITHLNQTMKIIENLYQSKKGEFTFEVRNSDFVLDRPDKKESFDVSVINPPYFKYNVKTSPYAKVVSDLYSGDPNIYASFMAIVASSLKEGGQMVAITPRSFTNGLYFKNFRNYLLNVTAIESIHIFKHRDRVFKNDADKVLQENIICKFVKAKNYESVEVRASDCDSSLASVTIQNYPVELIVDPSNDQRLIRIPESVTEANILKQAEQLQSTFTDSGYFISTGPVVEHRTRNFIVSAENHRNTVPLYRPHNVTPYAALWTGENKKDVRFELQEQHEKHTLHNKNYVLLKRFSSKDEKRRLVSGVYLEKYFDDLEFIGFGNKVNYIGVKSGELTKKEAYGLCAIFNSSFFDRYFRCISGNTQVNATEIRVIRFPTRNQVKEIGEEVLKLNSFDADKNNSIVNRVLKIKETV
jgi:adenine-specific DNA-methyltransferase